LDQHFEYTRTKLQPVLDDLELLANNIDCDINCIIEAIDGNHTIVVDTLLRCSDLYIMKAKKLS
jgi:hypothetical protein